LVKGVYLPRDREASERVLGLDHSPNIIRVSRERSAEFMNIDFQVTGAMAHDLPARSQNKRYSSCP
jgi:ubiquinone/menaquinone biosynthesis C-methylase UbiE